MKKSSVDASGQRVRFFASRKATIYAKFFKKMSVYLLATAVFLPSVACNPPCPPAPKPEIVTVTEYVTIPAPAPTIPARPVLPSAQLKDPTIQELVKALLADRELLRAWGLDLETRLKAYLTPEKEKEKK